MDDQLQDDSYCIVRSSDSDGVQCHRQRTPRHRRDKKTRTGSDVYSVGCRGNVEGKLAGNMERLRLSSDVDSLSSINPVASSLSCELPAEVKQVYKELRDISDKLKRELQTLSNRDAALKDNEALVAETQASLERYITTEVNNRLAGKEQELERLKEQIHDKTRENKRIKENFDTLKSANDTLHKELESLKLAHDKLYKQHCSLQARITNLQRLDEHRGRKETMESEMDRVKVSVSTRDSATTAATTTSQSLGTTHKQKIKTSQAVPAMSAGVYDILSVLFEWVSFSLQTSSTDCNSDINEMSATDIYDKCLRILPHLLDVIRDMSARTSSTVLPCLEFIYWSLVQLETATPGHQRVALPATFRRLGEELYCPRFTQQPVGCVAIGNNAAGITSSSSGNDVRQFLTSSDVNVRFLSALIILKTINQVDHVMRVFDILQNDLKADVAKQMFHHYRAVHVILSYIRPANKTLTVAAVDVLLQLSIEPSQFTEMCSSPTVSAAFFQKLALLWRSSTTDPQLLEKTSILLQKLSKIKSNRKYFEMYGITAVCAEILRTHGAESPFLALNVKSVLQNISQTVSVR